MCADLQAATRQLKPLLAAAVLTAARAHVPGRGTREISGSQSFPSSRDLFPARRRAARYDRLAHRHSLARRENYAVRPLHRGFPRVRGNGLRTPQCQG
jgi:hypothetical protein